MFQPKKNKKHQPKVKKSKNVGFIERLATPKPSKPRFLLRWLPTGRLFDQKGKIVDSSESESQSDCSNGDNACTSNTMEPKIKRFPNSTSLLGRWLFDSNLIREKPPRVVPPIDAALGVQGGGGVNGLNRWCLVAAGGGRRWGECAGVLAGNRLVGMYSVSFLNGMFRINPFKTSREENHVPNTVRASARTKLITVSQPRIFTKKDVNSDSNGLSSIGIDNTKNRRP
nr:hypothetical protein [Tanacetum cinerariifolium]